MNSCIMEWALLSWEAVLPLGRKFPFLRKFQPSEGNQKEIEVRRKKKEIRVKYKEY